MQLLCRGTITCKVLLIWDALVPQLLLSPASIFFSSFHISIFQKFESIVYVEFNKLLVNTISGAANEAASAPSGFKKLAAKKVIYTFLESLYVLVQCTPDLSTSDCNQCLLLANLSLSICCNNNRGVRVLFPSCNFRFDNYSFFNEVAFDAMSAASRRKHPPSNSGI